MNVLVLWRAYGGRDRRNATSAGKITRKVAYKAVYPAYLVQRQRQERTFTKTSGEGQEGPHKLTIFPLFRSLQLVSVNVLPAFVGALGCTARQLYSHFAVVFPH